MALVILGLIIIGGGAYFYTQNSFKTTPEVNSLATSTSEQVAKTTVNNSLSDEAFIKTTSDPKGKVVARGDINGDGYEDAIVKGITCGASCSVNLEVILNNKNIDAKVLEVSFEPGFKSSSAVKSNVTNVSIENEIISLTGYGLDCGGSPDQDTYICTQEKWNVLKTIKFRLSSTNGASKYYLERVGNSATTTNLENIVTTAYIVSIENNKITLDYIEILSGEAAKKAVVEDGVCTQEQVDTDNHCFNNGVRYDRNQNPKLRTFELAPNVIITTASAFATVSNGIKNISADELKRDYIWNRDGKISSPPYTVIIKNSVVTKIVEIYRP